jgi:hypothetical protein
MTLSVPQDQVPRVNLLTHLAYPLSLPGLLMALLLSQEEILFDLSGTKCPKVKDGRSLPSYMYIGHFLKPYFKDKVTGVVSSNERS